MEKTDSEESIQALRNLVLLVGSLSTCGYVELKPNSKADCLYQMPGFTVPQPSGGGQFCSLLFLFMFHSEHTGLSTMATNSLCRHHQNTAVIRYYCVLPRCHT